MFSSRRKKRDNISSNEEDEAYNFPDSNRNMATNGNLNPENLFNFDSSANNFSGSTFAASTRSKPPTNDMGRISDRKYHDKLFGVAR